MKIVTFSEAAELLGVSTATISRWTKEQKLREGSKAGKQKTVTQESIDTLVADPAFQKGRESGESTPSKKRKITQNCVQKEELEEVKQQVENLEKLVKDLAEEIENLRNITQNNKKEEGVVRRKRQRKIEKKEAK